ncbi:MAG TPA: hypothetical protein PKZ36_01675 [Candidatus Paceibacterota bacterium]|nr:hypothetical protein [Candidatus Paceibacterota bacterium]HPT18097.1 hypothetical protein [Candidatus Paceibacterota bacterium]
MRDLSIKSKLEYISTKKQELGNILFDSMIKNNKRDDISHLVADILQTSTECFDYCAQDIIELLILPTSQKLNKKEREKGFPFFINQLNLLPFNQLVSTNKLLYDYLAKLAFNADNNINIANTCISSSLPREIRILVNNKKHSDILEINNQGQEQIVADLEEMQVVIPVMQNGFTINEQIIEGNIKALVKATAYELKENGEEVFSFCVSCQTSTEIILNDIYKNFLGSKISFK